MKNNIKKISLFLVLIVLSCVSSWALLGWVQYDFNFMSTQSRPQLLLQIGIWVAFSYLYYLISLIFED